MINKRDKKSEIRYKILFIKSYLLSLISIFLPLCVIVYLISDILFPKIAHGAILVRPPSNLGLVGYWPMNEGVGDKVGDFSGNNFDGTLKNGPVWTSGKYGPGISTDGLNDYIQVQNNEKLKYRGENITLSIWINIDTSENDTGDLISKPWNGSGQYNYRLILNSNKTITLALVGASGATLTSDISVPVNSWHNIVATVNSAKLMEIYINGTIVKSASHNISSWVPTHNDLNLSLAIGTLYPYGDGWAGVTSHAFKGKIDDVRIYNRALSAGEIARLYSSGQVTRKTVSNLGLVGYWSFDEGAGTVAGDSSGSGNHGSITGATWTDGKRGRALEFNGTSDFVDLFSPPSLYISTDVTLSAWVNPHSLNSNFHRNPIISGRRTELSPVYGLLVSPTSVGISFQTDNLANGSLGYVNKAGATTINYNEWVMVSVVRSGLNLYFYKNGVLIGQDTFLAGNLYASNGYLIGKGYNGGSFFFDGLIDDVRIYNRALSAGEIAKLYQQSSATINSSQNNKMTDGLVGLWSFDGKDISGVTAYDRSGQGRNGTIYNSAPPVIGKIGQAMSFNNSNQYIASGAVFSEIGTSNQPYSVAAWVKIKSGVTTGNVVHVGDSWCLPPINITGGKLRATSWNGGQVNALGTTTLSPDVWYHVITTWNATNGLRIFVNGELENSTAMSIFSAAGSARKVYIGKDGGSCAGNTGALNGAVDDVRIYNRALSAEEVKQLYLMGK